jgi:hypothetical protein
MEESTSDGIWGVVISPGGKYVGKIQGSDKDEITRGLSNGLLLKLHPVYELSVMMIPVRTSDGGMGMSRQIQALPLGLNTYDLTVCTKASDVWFFDDMSKEDHRKYKDLVGTAIKVMQAERAKESNILLATGMPQGRGRG